MCPCIPMWRNWQTHTTQNRAGNHVGSSPTIGTREKIQAKLGFFCRIKKVGLEKELYRSFRQVKACMKRGKMVRWTILRRGSERGVPPSGPEKKIQAKLGFFFVELKKWGSKRSCTEVSGKLRLA